MGRGTKIHGMLNAPETSYARAKTAGWLLKSLEQKVTPESCFFECLRWVGGDLRRPLQAVMKEAQKPTGKSGIVSARKAIKEALPKPQDRLAGEFEDLLEEHACLEGNPYSLWCIVFKMNRCDHIKIALNTSTSWLDLFTCNHCLKVSYRKSERFFSLYWQSAAQSSCRCIFTSIRPCRTRITSR